MKTIYCPTKTLRPVIVDIARAMETVNHGECLEIISDKAFLVREAQAYAHMQGCEVIRISHRDVKTFTLSYDDDHRLSWNHHEPIVNHEWLIWLKKPE
ncbi:hypothetical protein [Sulfobacillus thermosulfidooxidans]|uniref:hypothetical protein n=1 Tax=Sulfobacillus thermosulfidooxidans TaxID=28034 RepID=UPI000400704D|nr:hypothetical protein [Sulfobacillus thermosulfidooxidans]